MTDNDDHRRLPSAIGPKSPGVKPPDLVRRGMEDLDKLLIGRSVFTEWVRAIKANLEHREVKAVTISSDGRWILLGCDETLKLWDVLTGGGVRTFEGHTGPVNSVAISPDSRWVLSGSDDATLKLWDVSKGREIRTFEGHTGPVNSVAISPDGRWVLSGSDDETLKLWDISTGSEVQFFEGHKGFSVNSVAISPNGRRVLSGSEDATLKLWDVSKGRDEIRTFKGHICEVGSIAISPDGHWILSGDWAGGLKLWNISNGREVQEFGWHEGTIGSVNSIVFSRDSRIAISAEVNRCHIWDIRLRERLASLLFFRDGTWAVFSPDGRYDAANEGIVDGICWLEGDQLIRLKKNNRYGYTPKLLIEIMRGIR